MRRGVFVHRPIADSAPAENEHAIGWTFHYRVGTAGCASELALVAEWGNAEGQLALFGDGGTVIATLGGNQRRVSGVTSSGDPLILERVGVRGMADVLEAARRASGCYYAGFTDDCVPDSALAEPEGKPARVKVLVNLNVRAEARDDANVLGVVPANSCITTDVCMEASDGVWCHAEFQDKLGWMRKLALRQKSLAGRDVPQPVRRMT